MQIRFRDRLNGFLNPKPRVSDIDIEVLAKSLGGSNPLSGLWDKMPHQFIENAKYDNINDTESVRRAIHTISNNYNTLGVYRSDFDKALNDRLAKNIYYAMCEKATLDYISTLEWNVVDKHGEDAQPAINFLDEPNPQDSFQSIIQMTLKDVLRYDAGVIVKSFNKRGFLGEIKAYLGTEFWKEVDRVQMKVPIPYQPTFYDTYWSHGYVRRYWQRAHVGIYVSYRPQEITYLCMYPQSDGIYGTDFIKYVQWQIQYLIDSTRAAGKTFANGVIPSLVWNHPDIVNRDTLAQRVQEVRQSNMSSNNFGSVLHTVGEEDVKTLASTLIDMQWLEGQKFVGSLIWAVYGFSTSEFIDSDSTRATAYVRRNITKSRMLYPLLRFYERKINTEILPYLKGYRKGWRFSFVRDMDLDDEMKVAQINAQKATTYSTYVNCGVTPSLAAKLSGVGDDITTDERESLDDIMYSMNLGDDSLGGAADTPDIGRYNTDAGYSEVTINGGGGDKDTYDPTQDQKDISKSRTYISDPSSAPKGRQVQRGNRGGYYYVSKPRSNRSNANHSESEKQPSRKSDGWGNGSRAPAGEDEQSAPRINSENVTGGSKQGAGIISGVRIHGEDVDVVFFMVKGTIKARYKGHSAIEVIRSVSSENKNDFMKLLRDAKQYATDNGLKFEVLYD